MLRLTTHLYTSVSSILQTQHITIVVRLAGELFAEEEVASEAHDKVSVDITKVIKKWETKT